MATVQQKFPVAPAALWEALPSGVTAAKGQVPYYDTVHGFVTFQTSLSMLSWGQNVTAKVEPAPEGATLTVLCKLKMGLIDFGEGKRIARRFIEGVSAAVGHTPV